MRPRGRPSRSATATNQDAASQSAAKSRASAGGHAPGFSIGDVATHPGPTEAPPVNKTGLPDRLKDGIEALSGISLHDVRVNYNSSKPALVAAHAYTQGTEIHVARGQERHLAHEAWHTVQQKRGEVRETGRISGVAISDDPSLEREADVMGARAAEAAR